MDAHAAGPSYSRGHRVLEMASIAFVLASLAWLGLRIARTAAGWDWFFVALASLGGYLISDFLSGFVHWAGDTVGDEQTPIVGANFVRPFRYHHVDPRDITRHDFVETNGNNCIVAAPALLLLLVVLPATAGTGFYACVMLAATCWFVFCTNQFHKWAHTESPPAWVRALQRAGLILSPEHHAVHHDSPHDQYYCITVGWMNPLLESIGFFRAVESVISRIAPGVLRPDVPR